MGRKKSDGWRENLSIDDQARRFFERYDSTPATMQGIFDRVLKVTQELLDRIEREMFRGMQYQAATDTTKSLFDKDLTKAAEGLGKLVGQLSTIHLRMAKEGERKARELSLDEQIDLCIKFVTSLPLAYRKTIMKALNAKVKTK